MDTANIIAEIFEICIIPVLGAVAVFVVKWINQKAKTLKSETDNATAKKYIDMLAETVSKCVLATNQTYVNSLKESGSFDEKAQKKAFKMTYTAVLSILTDEAKTYITEAVGDFDVFLTQQIEAEIGQVKDSTNVDQTTVATAATVAATAVVAANVATTAPTTNEE